MAIRKARMNRKIERKWRKGKRDQESEIMPK